MLFRSYVVGVVTAVGGGTIRDILLNATPFWMEQASYLIISALALLFVIIFRKYVISLNNTFFIFDAIGLGLLGARLRVVGFFSDFSLFKGRPPHSCGANTERNGWILFVFLFLFYYVG